jgi:hypothetical protein
MNRRGKINRVSGGEKSFPIKKEKLSQESPGKKVKVFGKAFAFSVDLYAPSGLDPEVCGSTLDDPHGLPLAEGQNRTGR